MPQRVPKYLSFLLLPVVAACGGDGGGGSVVTPPTGTFSPSFFPAPVTVPLVGSGTFHAPAMCCEGNTVLVAYHDPGGQMIRANLSTDGGATWLSPDMPIAPVVTLGTGGITACCAGGYAHVGWADRGDILDVGSGMRVASALLSNPSWTVTNLHQVEGGFQEPPALCCEGPNAFAGWGELVPGSGSVRFSRTTNGGGTWSPSLPLNLPGTCDDMYRGGIWCEANRVVVVLEGSDCANGPRDHSAQVRVSTDTGQTFGAPIRLDTTSAGSDDIGARYPRVTGRGLQVTATWTLRNQSLATNLELRSNSSVDGGATWGDPDPLVAFADSLVSTEDHDDGGEAHELLCSDDARAYTGWRSSGNPRDVHVAIWDPATWSWTSTPALNAADAGPVGPALACTDARVFAVYRDLNRDVHVLWSEDSGATWSPDTTTIGGAAALPLLVCESDGHLYVLWQNSVGTTLFLNAHHP